MSCLANVSVVQGGINFIQNKERSRTKAERKYKSHEQKLHPFLEVEINYTEDRQNMYNNDVMCFLSCVLCLTYMLPVNGKYKCQGSDGLLPSRQVVHGHETLPWSHTVVVDAIQVGLLWILRTQEGLRETVLNHLKKISQTQPNLIQYTLVKLD